MKIIEYLNNKLPTRRELFLQFGACVLITHLYTFVVLLFSTPPLFLRMKIGEIVGVIAYVLSVALIESIGLFVVLLLLCIILPYEFFRARFLSQGSLLALILAVWSIGVKPQGQIISNWYFKFFIPILIFSIFMTIYSHKLREIIENILDKISVLSTIYVLVDLLCILIVIARNLS